MIFADYDANGARDANEPFTETDAHGDYVLKDIRPPASTAAYTLRETPVTEPAQTSWRCSYPTGSTPPDGFANGAGGLLPCGWGPIPASEPVAEGRDFGNWLPAQLTVEKQLTPTDDPGRFDLKVNTETVVPGAGDRASWTGQMKPGSYDITEQAVPGTDPDAYNSSVTCQTKTRQRGRVRAGTSYQGLVLTGGRSRDLHVHQRAQGRPRHRDRKGRPADRDRRRHAALHVLRHQPRRRAAPAHRTST